MSGKGEQRAVLRLEAAPLGVGETGRGKSELGNGLESPAGVIEPEFERSGERTGDGGCGRCGPEHGEGVAQEPLALGLVLGEPEGGQERQCLAIEELMLGPAAHQVALKLRVGAGQGISEGGADGEGINLALDGGVELKEGEAAHHPGLATAQAARDGGDTHVGLGEHRVDDAGFIERRECARRSVGAKDQRESVNAAGDRLEDDGYARAALLAPAVQALEAVYDLEGAVRARDHAKRQIRQGNIPVLLRAAPTAKEGEARTKLIDGDGNRPGGSRGHHSGLKPTTRTRVSSSRV